MRKIKFIVLLLGIVLLESCCSGCGDSAQEIMCQEAPIYPDSGNDFALTLNLANSHNYDDLQTIFVSPLLKGDINGDFDGALAIAAKLSRDREKDSEDYYYDVTLTNVSVRRLQGAKYKIVDFGFYNNSGGPQTLLFKMEKDNNIEDQAKYLSVIKIDSLHKGNMEINTTLFDLPEGDIRSSILKKICQLTVN